MGGLPAQGVLLVLPLLAVLFPTLVLVLVSVLVPVPVLVLVLVSLLLVLLSDDVVDPGNVVGYVENISVDVSLVLITEVMVLVKVM